MPLGPGTARLIAYQRFERSPVVSLLEEPRLPLAPEVFVFTQDSDEGESILRGEYSWPKGGERNWEVAAEGAFNFLESDTAFTREGTVDAFPTVRVEEIRAQGSVTRSTRWGDKLNVQASVGAEWSEISRETEGGEAARRFFRPKGFVSFAYPCGEDTDLRFRVDRSVGQLDFFDFVSSLDFVNDRENAGNATLRPQQAWEFEAEAERRFGPEEKVVLRVETAFIEDLVDRILLDGRDAVGNIDDARSTLLSLEGTMLTNRFGLEGGRLDVTGNALFSAFEDPLTGQDREFNLRDRWFARADFRHDVPNTDYAWGFGVGQFDGTPQLRAFERSQFGLSVPLVSVFAEHKDVFGATLRITGSNLLDQDEEFRRVVYGGVRTEAPILVVEDRARGYGPILSISLSGTF